MVPPAGLLPSWSPLLLEDRIGGRKVERRLKWEIRFVVTVSANSSRLREVTGREVIGAAAQLMRMVGWVSNFSDAG